LPTAGKLANTLDSKLLCCTIPSDRQEVENEKTPRSADDHGRILGIHFDHFGSETQFWPEKPTVTDRG